MNKVRAGISGIRVNWKHIDGPLMILPDGQLRWLTRRERFMHWIGRWSLEDIACRPDSFSKRAYSPLLNTWISARSEAQGDAQNDPR